MSYCNPLLIKPFKGSAAVNPYRIVKFTSDDLTVGQAAAATDSLIGVANSVGIDAAGVTAGATLDVIVSGIAEIEFGGIVARGGPVTADANGKGVAAAPGAGSNNRIIGFAMKTTASGDIAPVLLSPGSIQG
jgi:hypothetical protein